MKKTDYIVEDAAEVIINNISKNLLIKLSYEDIIEILETEFQFLQLTNVASEQLPIINIVIKIPTRFDEDAMEYFIINQCAKKNIYLTFEELQEILDAEMLYLKQQGLVDDEGPCQYLN